MTESSTTTPAAASTTLATLDDSLESLRASYPDVTMSAEVIEGRVADGFSIELHGYFGVDLIAVKAPTADGAVELILSELDRARREAR